MLDWFLLCPKQKSIREFVCFDSLWLKVMKRKSVIKCEWIWLNLRYNRLILLNYFENESQTIDVFQFDSSLCCKLAKIQRKILRWSIDSKENLFMNYSECVEHWTIENTKMYAVTEPKNTQKHRHVVKSRINVQCLQWIGGFYSN